MFSHHPCAQVAPVIRSIGEVWTTTSPWQTATEVDFFYDFDNVPEWAVASTGTCGTNGNSSDACTGMVANMSDWTNYVTALVQRYDGKHGHGRILIYEIWNEPNNAQDWTGTQEQLAALARQVVSIVRANDAAQGVNPPTHPHDTLRIG